MTYSQETYIAGNKFGLGLRPYEAAGIKQDPRGWLLDQLGSISTKPRFLQELPDSAQFLDILADNRMDMQRRRQDSDNNGAAQTAFRDSRRKMAKDQQDHNLLRLQTAIETDTPFAERLLHFWSNHFTVAASPGPKDIIRQIALPYEQEAIRSNLDKNFAQLLLAVEQHPAMLVYLDNLTSFGPTSLVGRRRNRGLNENLAREILELHTLGVNGGYSQEDVTSLAKIITGWTIGDARFDRLPGLYSDSTTGFTYVRQLHEPGDHVLLGKRYRARDIEQGEDALNDLARHPATARHIAEKLARHFVSDQPPESAVTTLEHVFLDTDGDLPSLHETLVSLDEAWDPDRKKFKTPQDYIVSSARALDLGATITSQQRLATLFSRILATFNQLPFSALSPAGWEDGATYWGGPDALMKRVEWANTLAGLAPAHLDVQHLAVDILPPDAFLDQELSRAESARQGMTLLVASPNFQWR